MNIKKISIMITLSLLLSSCIYEAGMRPTDQDPALWVSESPDIWFEVFEYDDQQEYQAVGYAINNGVETKFYVFFGYSSVVHFYDYENDEIDLMVGRCTFYKDKLIVKVVEGKDTLFHNAFNTLTFIRRSK